MKRIINNGTKTIHIGGGKTIDPGCIYDCDLIDSAMILEFCPFCDEVEFDQIVNFADLDERNFGERSGAD